MGEPAWGWGGLNNLLCIVSGTARLVASAINQRTPFTASYMIT